MLFLQGPGRNKRNIWIPVVFALPWMVNEKDNAIPVYRVSCNEHLFGTTCTSEWFNAHGVQKIALIFHQIQVGVTE